MSDMKSDWNKWSTAERISAMALIVTFIIVFASSIAGALDSDRAVHGGVSGLETRLSRGATR